MCGAPPWIQRSETHVAHQTLNPVAVDAVATVFEFVTDTPASVERALKVNLVDEPHQGEVGLTDRLRSVVRRRTGHIEQLASTPLR